MLSTVTMFIKVNMCKYSGLKIQNVKLQTDADRNEKKVHYCQLECVAYFEPRKNKQTGTYIAYILQGLCTSNDFVPFSITYETLEVGEMHTNEQQMATHYPYKVAPSQEQYLRHLDKKVPLPQHCISHRHKLKMWYTTHL